MCIDHCAFEFLSNCQGTLPRKIIPLKKAANNCNSYEENYSLDIQLAKKTKSTITISDSSFFGYGLKIHNSTKVIIQNCEIQQICRGAESSLHLSECSNIHLSYCNVVNSLTENSVLIESKHSCRAVLLNCRIAKCRKIGLFLRLDPYRH